PVDPAEDAPEEPAVPVRSEPRGPAAAERDPHGASPARFGALARRRFARAAARDRAARARAEPAGRFGLEAAPDEGPGAQLDEVRGNRDLHLPASVATSRSSHVFAATRMPRYASSTARGSARRRSPRAPASARARSASGGPTSAPRSGLGPASRRRRAAAVVWRLIAIRCSESVSGARRRTGAESVATAASARGRGSPPASAIEPARDATTAAGSGISTPSATSTTGAV